MPSSASAACSSSAICASSAGSTCGAISTTVTAESKRAQVCAISRPIGPPPTITIDRGSSPEE